MAICFLGVLLSLLRWFLLRWSRGKTSMGVTNFPPTKKKKEKKGLGNDGASLDVFVAWQEDG